MTASPSTSADFRSASSADVLLGRGLGVGAIVFMVVAAAAPLGVVAANVPLVIAVSGTPAAPLYFTAATVILFLFAVGFTAMTRYVPNAGAFYSYIQAGLGRHTGTGAALVALVSYVLLFVGVNAYVGVAAAGVIETFTGADTPWWLWSLVSLAVIGVLGYRDIELSSKVLGVLLIAETLVIVIMDVAIIAQGGREGLSAQSWSPAELVSGTPSLGLMFAFFCFIGFEATAVFRNEAKDPDRTIPRATYVAVLSIGVFYALSSWAVVVGIGTPQAVEAATSDPENVVLDLASTYVAPILGDVMHVLLATSFFACVLSFHNVITRYLFTLGRKHVLPPRLGRVNARHRAPSTASATTTAVTGVLMLVAIVAGLDPVSEVYTWLSGSATLGLVLLMAVTSVAAIVFFRRRREGTPWQTIVAPGLAALGLGAVSLLVIQNLDLLVGSVEAAIVVSVVIGGSFAAGVALAEHFRRRRPEVYGRLAE